MQPTYTLRPQRDDVIDYFPDRLRLRRFRRVDRPDFELLDLPVRHAGADAVFSHAQAPQVRT